MRRRTLLSAMVVAAGLCLGGPASAQVTQRALRDRIDQLKIHAASLERGVQAAKEAGIDAPLDRAAASLQLGKSYLDQADLLRTLRSDSERTAFWADLAEYTLREGALLMTPSRNVEARGILLDADSIPKTVPEVKSLVGQLAAARFNMLLPEVIRRGYSVYPTRLTERDPDFASAPDVLAAMVKEAHRLGMEVHPWVWTLRVRSYDEKNDFGNPVISRLPGLAARSESTGKPRFLSPAAPGAREFILRTISDLIDRYDVDGLFLDYIRYDEETPDDWTSQTNYRLERFGADAPWGEIDKRDYQLWREEKVNRIVSEISALLRTKPRTLALSAATFRSESYARRTKLQNWRHWTDNAWLTYTTSMLYSDDARDIVGWIAQETEAGKRPTLFYPILGIHRMEDPSRALLEQLRAVRSQGQPGVLIFALGHLPRVLLADLARGPFRTPAVPPHRNPLGAAKQVLRQLGEQFFPRQAASADWATVAAARVLGAEVNSVVRTMPSGPPYYQSAALVERLAGLHEVASRLERVNPGFQSEVTGRLRYASALVRAHAHRTETTRYLPPAPPGPDTGNGNAKPERP